jgi:hypothetical protein
LPDVQSFGIFHPVLQFFFSAYFRHSYCLTAAIIHSSATNCVSTQITMSTSMRVRAIRRSNPQQLETSQLAQIHGYLDPCSASVTSVFPKAAQLAWVVAGVSEFLYGKAAVLWDTMSGTSCI